MDLNSKLSAPNSICFNVAFPRISRSGNTCRFSAQVSQVIEFSTSDFTAASNFYVVNDGCVKWENAFNSDPKLILRTVTCFASSAVFAGDNNAFKRLQTFFFPFLNPNMHADIIARLKVRNIFFHLCFFNTI